MARGNLILWAVKGHRRHDMSKAIFVLKQQAGVDASRSPLEIAFSSAPYSARQEEAARRRNLGALLREAKGIMGWKAFL